MVVGALAFRVSVLCFFAIATYGLGRIAEVLAQSGLPVALLLLLVVPAWLAIAIATVQTVLAGER